MTVHVFVSRLIQDSGTGPGSVSVALGYLPLGSWRWNVEMIHPGPSPAERFCFHERISHGNAASANGCSSSLGRFHPNRGKYGILERRWRSVLYEVMSLWWMDTCPRTPTSRIRKISPTSGISGRILQLWLSLCLHKSELFPPFPRLDSLQPR